VTGAVARSWVKPRRLRSGDRIALVAPASPFKPEELDAGVAELARLGFEAVYDERVFARRRYVAGTAAVRASALHDAWSDPSIAALIAMRGGYGSAQLLPLLDASVMQRAAKVFIGYSDVTTLLWFHLRHGLVSFHGPMIERRFAAGETGYDRASFLRAVQEAAPMGELTPPELAALKAGEASGVLVGGTLTQMTASLGTPWACEPPPGCLLFLEDVGERPYRIDRMLTQLAQAGILARAGGLIVGELPSCDEPAGEPRIRDVLNDFFQDFPGPVLFGFPSGHATGPTWTLPFGVRARIVTSPPALVIEEAAVE
jgi:muramoyltetrapeptide carboxypeptidase